MIPQLPPQKDYTRHEVPQESWINWKFMPGVDPDKCLQPYCHIKNFTKVHVMHGCTLYDRSSYEWACKPGANCPEEKHDRPFITAQKLAATFRTEADLAPPED